MVELTKFSFLKFKLRKQNKWHKVNWRCIEEIACMQAIKIGFRISRIVYEMCASLTSLPFSIACQKRPLLQWRELSNEMDFHQLTKVLEEVAEEVELVPAVAALATVVTQVRRTLRALQLIRIIKILRGTLTTPRRPGTIAPSRWRWKIPTTISIPTLSIVSQFWKTSPTRDQNPLKMARIQIQTPPSRQWSSCRTTQTSRVANWPSSPLTRIQEELPTQLEPQWTAKTLEAQVLCLETYAASPTFPVRELKMLTKTLSRVRNRTPWMWLKTWRSMDRELLFWIRRWAASWRAQSRARNSNNSCQ